MSKELRCVECKTHIGEMTKGRIKKGSVFLCDSCNTKRIANKLKDQYKPKSDIGNIFGDIFK